MRRFSYIILISFILSMCFSGCKPSNMSQTSYAGAKIAIEAAEQYLDMELSARDAFEKIDTVSSRVDAIENTDTGDIYVGLYLTTLKYAIQREESDASIQSEIDNLKNAIGK